jgi:hypothetical protein
VSSWYYNKNLKPQGPLSFDEIKKKILRGEIGPTELIMREGEGAWKAAQEWREFTPDLFPAFQKNYFKKSNIDEKEWILLTFDRETAAPQQQGPFSIQNLQEMLRTNLVSIEDYIWRSGLTGWVQLKDREEFAPKPTSLDL